MQDFFSDSVWQFLFRSMIVKNRSCQINPIWTFLVHDINMSFLNIGRMSSLNVTWDLIPPKKTSVARHVGFCLPAPWSNCFQASIPGMILHTMRVNRYLMIPTCFPLIPCLLDDLGLWGHPHPLMYLSTSEEVGSKRLVVSWTNGLKEGGGGGR